MLTLVVSFDGTSSTNMKLFVQNCSNYGRPQQLTYGFNFNVGGIIGGITDNTFIQNCFNIGEFAGERNLVGNIKIENEVLPKIKIENCYWFVDSQSDKYVGILNNVNAKNLISESTGFFDNLTLCKSVIVDNEEKTEINDALNFFNNTDFNKWMVLNFNGGSISNGFPLNRVPFHKNKNVLIQPIKKGCTFKGWFLDPEYKSKFNPEINSIIDTNELYARWIFPIKVTFIFGAKKN